MHTATYEQLVDRQSLRNASKQSYLENMARCFLSFQLADGFARAQHMKDVVASPCAAHVPFHSVPIVGERIENDGGVRAHLNYFFSFASCSAAAFHTRFFSRLLLLQPEKKWRA